MRAPAKEFNRDGQLLQYGYVIQWPDKSLQPDTFDCSRHKCWMRLCAPDDDPGLMKFNRARAGWKKSGARCVAARRTISVEGAR